jgi:phage terminase large subunit-like protein
LTDTTGPSERSWTNWPLDAKQALLARLKRELWRGSARPEQLPPEGDWRVWYLQGGRGAGKTRTGSETLADWITERDILTGDAGNWGILAPTYGDARDVCVEGPSGILKALGPLVVDWNRSMGEMKIAGGSRIYLDGADDGALRIQGTNLRGAWADEVCLWKKWEQSWNESLRFAVRIAPAKIVATGTPKMGHGLVRYLVNADEVVITRMATTDNVANLDQVVIDELLSQYRGSRLGLQELEGQYFEGMEGDLLRRADWRYYPPEWGFYCPSNREPEWSRLPAFQYLVSSWDTSIKDRKHSDYVSGQLWGVIGTQRWLIRLFHGQAALAATIQAMIEQATWALRQFPDIPLYVLVEETSNGPDAMREIRKLVQGVIGIQAKGPKGMRAQAATPALEGHHCFLPGEMNDEGTDFIDERTPAPVQQFVEEASEFTIDETAPHDDQVDGWSQMVNWTRDRGMASMSVPHGQVSMPRFRDDRATQLRPSLRG